MEKIDARLTQIWDALLLVSDAGSFITGEEIIVDGGYVAMTIQFNKDLK